MEFAIFVIGVSLIVVSFLLTFLNKVTLQATIAVVLGVACALAGAGFLPSIKGGGVEAIIDKKVSDTKGNITQSLAPINLKLQISKEGLDGQPNFNKMFRSCGHAFESDQTCWPGRCLLLTSMQRAIHEQRP